MRNETRTLLRSYIKRDLYISEKHYLVSSKPDRKTKEWVDVLRTTINILLSFWL